MRLEYQENHWIVIDLFTFLVSDAVQKDAKNELLQRLFCIRNNMEKFPEDTYRELKHRTTRFKFINDVCRSGSLSGNLHELLIKISGEQKSSNIKVKPTKLD